VKVDAAVLVPVYRSADGELRLVREAWEEIGIAAETVDVIAELPIVDARTTGYRVYPFLGRLLNPGQWRRSEREIAEIIDVNLGDFARADAHDRVVEQLSTWKEPQEIPFYRVGPYRLWGLSYRILHPLIPRLLAGEWSV
jgi:8-oxo-dGTP pyrophosphatase MutT (NUDIX family)